MDLSPVYLICIKTGWGRKCKLVRGCPKYFILCSIESGTLHAPDNGLEKIYLLVTNDTIPAFLDHRIGTGCQMDAGSDSKLDAADIKTI